MSEGAIIIIIIIIIITTTKKPNSDARFLCSGTPSFRVPTGRSNPSVCQGARL